jgi:hypothetical protein
VPDPKLRNEIKEPHFYSLLLPIFSNEREQHVISIWTMRAPVSTSLLVILAK